MRLRWTFFHVFRLMWLGTNGAILAATAVSWRDLSGLTFMLSFPASVVAGLIALIAFDATGWSATTLVTVLTEVAAVASGYVQWFVIGRALAHRIVARCPVQRLPRAVLQAGIVSACVVLGAIGLEIVQADEQAGHFIDRAMTVREGMSGKQVQSILGDPHRYPIGPPHRRRSASVPPTPSESRRTGTSTSGFHRHWRGAASIWRFA